MKILPYWKSEETLLSPNGPTSTGVGERDNRTLWAIQRIRQAGTGICNVKSKKYYFFDFVFLKCSYGFLSMIFGFLTKFWVAIYIFEIKNIFFQKKIFSETNIFHWKSLRKINVFLKISFFLEISIKKKTVWRKNIFHPDFFKSDSKFGIESIYNALERFFRILLWASRIRVSPSEMADLSQIHT